MSENSNFKIVLLHDGPVAGQRGLTVLERLAGQLEMGPDELVTHCWDFDVLAQPEARGQIAGRLVEANMLILSAGGAAALPAGLKNWLEQVLELRRGHEAALVALLDWEQSGGGELPRLGAYLRDLADRTGLDFFCNQGEEATPQRTPEAQLAAIELDGGFGAHWEVAPRDSGGLGWGIND
jgi:hypothetical protein